MHKQLTVIFFILVLYLYPVLCFSQELWSLSGEVKDARTGESLIGVSILIPGESNTGTRTNNYGHFAITLNKGTTRIMFAYVGYDTQEITIDLNANKKLDIRLQPAGNSLNEVLITLDSKNDKVNSNVMGLEKLSREDINKLPVIFGEKDVIKALQLLPGVKNTGDGNGGFYVRGGAADQNLIVLDEAIVYNPDHLLGFFSTFNADAIKEVSLYKGNMPAQYGGRLSSVMNVIMKDGNNQNFQGEAGIGLISSRLSFEGPILKDKGSYFISGRRTYVDLFLKASSDPIVNENKLYFYDLNFKANYTLGANDQLYIAAYQGRDNIGFGEQFGITWGNTTGSIRWNHQFSPKVFSNSSLIYSNYDYEINLDMASINGQIISQIKDWNLKEEIKFYPNNNHAISLGVNAIYHQLRPGTYAGDISLVNKPLNFSFESAVYAADNWKASKKLQVDYGLRLSSFAALGGDQPYYTLNGNKEIINTTYYGNHESAKTYVYLEPRLSLSYLFDNFSSWKAAYSRNSQYLHLLSNTGTGNPTDKWVSSNINIKPGISDMFSLGYARNLFDGTYQLSIESYFKNMQHQIDYKDGANVLSGDPIDPQLLYGDGKAYGMELLLRKNAGKLTGWLGYTISRTEVQIDGINDGRWYNARQDRTHDISLVGMYRVNTLWDMSASFVYYTGHAVSFPSGKYDADGQVAFYYAERNGYRMPAYHRLDLSATRKFKPRKHYRSELSLGVFNAYGRANAYSISFRKDPHDPEKTQAVQTSLFRFVPSISYNFKF
ncbi:TonB-dependent receptor [Pedobacter sp.]|uniref:TonB-dependent receptor n=1 Tax=Pedobacter sp. TaxID=1411316 RepID=UPI003D7F30CB